MTTAASGPVQTVKARGSGHRRRQGSLAHGHLKPSILSLWKARERKKLKEPTKQVGVGKESDRARHIVVQGLDGVTTQG